jgi:peroxiredoxin
MIRTMIAAGMLALTLAAPAAQADSVARLGEAAPAFTLVDSSGKARSLAEFKGKFVVLEWTNHDCPYVRKHYGAGNMQALQKEYGAKGVTWLTLISSKPGTQGYVTDIEADELTRTRNAQPTAVLFDGRGEVGRAYGAKVTPHMYVIDPKGTLVYMGGIDDKATANQADIPTARPHVRMALDEAMAGKPVSVASTRAYGCTVKY